MFHKVKLFLQILPKKGKTSPMKKRTASPKRRESSPSKSKKTKRSKSKDKGALSPRADSAASGKIAISDEKVAMDVVPATPASDVEPDWLQEEKMREESTKRKIKKFQPVVTKKDERRKSRLVISPETASKSDKPVFVEIPEPQEHVVGELATFACRVGGNPMPEIQWYKGKWGKLSSFGRIKVTYDKQTGVSVLQVSNSISLIKVCIELLLRINM